MDSRSAATGSLLVEVPRRVPQGPHYPAADCAPRPHRVAGLGRNGWPTITGMVAGIDRNERPQWAGIRSIPYRLQNRCFGSRRASSAIPRREVGRRVSGPSCPAPVSCAGCESLSTASPCGRLSRPLITTSGSDFRKALHSSRSRLPGPPQDPRRISQFLDASLLHIPRSSWTPADPRGLHPVGPSVWASGTLTPSPSAFPLLRGCVKLPGVRSPLRSMWCPVYASAGSFGITPLLSNCNTRYGWLVRPCPAGTLALQEAPSFA